MYFPLLLFAVLSLRVFCLDLEPVLVQVIARHGDRTPITVIKPLTKWICYETHTEIPDLSGAGAAEIPTPGRLYRRPYSKSELPGNCTTGHLTQIGAKQHQALGRYYRKKYVDSGFLSKSPSSKEIFARSTDVPRTFLSAANFLNGMYPPNKGNQNTQVLNIFSRSYPVENLVCNTEACPALQKEFQKRVKTPLFQERNKEISGLTQVIEKAFDLTPLPPWTHIFDWLFARHSHNKPLYPGISQKVQEQVFQQADWLMTHYYSPRNISRLGLGYFLTEVGQHIQEKMNESQKGPKFRLYLAHDTSIGPLLVALGIFDGKWPPYAAHMEITLLRDVHSNSDMYISVSYLGKLVLLPHQHSHYIKVSEFFKLYADVMPTDDQYLKECSL